MYVRSPEAMKRMALSYDSLLADVYWIRAVQHYGGTKRSTIGDQVLRAAVSALDLTTSLDPLFNVAYPFGAIFLAEPAPGGPGQPDQAIALLQKGLKAQPDNWRLIQALGFVYYWWYEDYKTAASWFERAAEAPGRADLDGAAGRRDAGAGWRQECLAPDVAARCANRGRRVVSQRGRAAPEPARRARPAGRAQSPAGGVPGAHRAARPRTGATSRGRVCSAACPATRPAFRIAS